MKIKTNGKKHCDIRDYNTYYVDSHYLTKLTIKRQFKQIRYLGFYCMHIPLNQFIKIQMPG